MKKKLFTKSAFKIALECPRRLYYAYDSNLYANQDLTDDFLISLAEGGFQVGELAKVYYGVKGDADIDVLGYDEAVEKTKELFKNDTINIAEAAFRSGNLFVRADIVEKKGNDITLIEVKAKSWEPSEEFIGKKGAVASDIRPYLYDVAFQKYVVIKALEELYPNEKFTVKARLMMADKSKVASVDGLNQMFRICKHENRSYAVADAKAWTEAAAVPEHERVLTAFDVDEYCDMIIAGLTAEQGQGGFMENMPFQEFVDLMSKHYCERIPFKPTLGKECFACPFYKTDKDDKDLRDGYKECWSECAHFTDADFDKPLVKELSGQYIRRDNYIKNGKYFMSELTYDDLARSKYSSAPGLDHLQRKWLQIGIATGNDDIKKDFGSFLQDGIYLDTDGLKDEMATWTYPLHFIDFETSAVALPFYKGQRPYEQTAFQFSHHKVEMTSDGEYTVTHASQYINTEKGFFPNFEFVRALKTALEGDNGTIFRYSHHENTILNKIKGQLERSDEADKDELISFIESITKGGPRAMVDLAELVLKYYYHPLMKGSYSIKVVLPSVLNSSEYIKSRYSKAIYGTDEMKSLNLKDKVWIKYDEDGTTVLNPYKLLDPVSSYLNMTEEDMEKMETLGEEETIANGGAALAAYSKLQFTDEKMTDALEKALLCYCELDTLAMVFIWEYFYHACQRP
jgi:hypothetical protein